jgi:hypothetical protein
MEDIVELVRNLFHANDIVTTRAKDPAKEDVVFGRISILWPIRDRAGRLAPMWLQASPVGTVTALIDADIGVGVVVYIDHIRSAVAIDVNETGAGGFVRWVCIQNRGTGWNEVLPNAVIASTSVAPAVKSVLFYSTEIYPAIAVDVRETDFGLGSFLFPYSTDELELGWVPCTIERHMWNTILIYQVSTQAFGTTVLDLPHQDI